MIIAALYGGLGNQMFQYAAARAAALRSGQDLALDLSWFTRENANCQRRRYLLDKFQIKATIATENDLELIKAAQIMNGDLQQRDASKLKIIKEHSFEFQGELRSEEGSAYLDGYWQTEKYFLDFADQIRSELRICSEIPFKDLPTITHIPSRPAVAIHVRRGDFVNDPKTFEAHGLCSLDYYYKAATLLIARLGSPRFFVFSDEVDWCRSNLLLPTEADYVGNSDVEDPTMDFRLMSQCEHFVNANSSFSWWASWLARNPEKIVIAPQKLIEGDWLNTKDYFPLHWIRL